MPFLIIATFKSQKTSAEVKSWLTAVSPVASVSSAQIALAPSFPYLPLINPPIQAVAQDVSPFPPGSYTGAVSAVQLKDLGVSYCLIGHSERRRYFHETHSEIAAKVSELLENRITPVLCLAKDDISPQFASLDESQLKNIIFVYEPPADIGGTETAPIKDIHSVTTLIRDLAPTSPVLYGGSVNAGNLSSLESLTLDGVLVSTASLSSQSFIDILNAFKG